MAKEKFQIMIILQNLLVPIRACRKVNANIPLMIHLDNGGNNELYVRWFENYMKRGEDFEYIGLSYYPFGMDRLMLWNLI